MKPSSTRCSTPWVISLQSVRSGVPAFTASAVTVSAVTVMVLATLGGCGAVNVDERRARAEQLAAEQGWQRDTVQTSTFDLAVWSPPGSGVETLTIYIEGDGYAWATRYKPSFNPTPKDPVGLALALAHTDGQAAYLARPCQYTDLSTQPDCDARVWTNKRFGEGTVVATNEAVTAIKARFGAEEIVLVGYSGGGALAVLLAARRDDVKRVTTVAAPLDHEFWTEQLRVTPLRGSLNPADVWRAVVDLPQIHYVGSEDEVIDLSLARAYRARFPATSPIRILVMEGFDHRCCWATAWPALQEDACPTGRCRDDLY